MPTQPAPSFETSALARSVPRSGLPNSSWLAQTQLGSSRELELSPGLALCFTELLRGHGCFSMVTIKITLYQMLWSIQCCFYNELGLFISSCLLKETLGREGACSALPGLFCSLLGLSAPCGVCCAGSKTRFLSSP